MTERAAAYGELVAGILDVRDPSPTRRFDDALRAAVAAGRLDARTAAELRWLQRESLQALVDHARTALPAALLGLDEARAATSELTGGEPVTPEPAAEEAGAEAEPTLRSGRASAGRRPVPPWPLPTRPGVPWSGEPAAAADTPEPPDEGEPEEPAVRRLLVAGLTSLTGFTGPPAPG